MTRPANSSGQDQSGLGGGHRRCRQRRKLSEERERWWLLVITKGWSIISCHQEDQLSPRECHYHLTKTEDGSPAPAVHHKNAENVTRDLDHHTDNDGQHGDNGGDDDDHDHHDNDQDDDDDGLPEHKVCVGSSTWEGGWGKGETIVAHCNTEPL